jgi:hypothetical protein
LTEFANLSPHGGSAAILGFLYQLQATATRLLEAHIQHSAAGGSVDAIHAILEPASGGDAIVEASERHCIQFKLRSQAIDIGTLTDAVLPDLFGAHCEQVCDRYELQSNQRLTKPAAALFSFLKGELEATTVIERDCQRAKKSCLTLFMKRNGNEHGFDEAFEMFARRLHLATPTDVAASRNQLEEFFNPHIPYGDQIDAKLDQLTGNLLERASKNGSMVTGPMIAEIIGLAIVTDAQARLETALKAALDARQYDLAHDIRPPLSVSAVTGLDLIAGQSGNGKSWALCRLAQEAIDTHRPALLIRAASRAELEREMKRLIAVEALSHDSPIEPYGLGKLWRRHTRNDAATILVLWEGCSNAEELRQALYQNGLGDGLTLIAELPPEVDLATFRNAGVIPHEVGTFGESELFDALHRRGVNAGAVPAEIRRMLRHPVLCGFYAQLAIDDGGWNPSNEYLVLQRFWDRARDKAGQTAGARLKALAAKMVEKTSAEATDSEIVALGFTDEQLGQLAASGWLAELSGKWRFAHDRLLTWAIAEWLAERLCQPSVGADEIASHIETLQNDSPEDRTRLHGLGFLMMDVLWLAASGSTSATKLAGLLALLEDDRQYRSSQNFYRELCPTIGPAIVDSLLARVVLVTNENSDYGIVGNVAAAIRALKLPAAAQDLIVRRLSEGDDKAWKLLLLLGSEWPLTAHRERIWDGLVDAYRHIGTEQKNYAGFERHREAALCICNADPAWHEAKVLSTTDAKSLGIATSLWVEMDPAPGRDQWDRLSPHLFDHMDPDDHGRLVGLVRRLGDRARIPFLIEQIDNRTHWASDSIAALVHLDPASALEIIASKPTIPYLPYAGIWLNRLLDHSPSETRELIDAWLMQVDPTGRMLASLWSGEEPLAGPATIAILLHRLNEEFSQEGGGDEPTTRTLLGFLGSGKLDPAGDETFHATRGSRLVSHLRIRLEGHARGAQNPLADEIWTLLLRIGGEDFEAYVINLLDGDVEHRGFGVGSAVFAPTPGVINRLEAMAVDWLAAYPEPTRKAIWRILVVLDPDKWYPPMLALLTAETDPERALGLELFDDLGFAEDVGVLVNCVQLTQSGSALEARAINLAAHYGASDPVLLERALPRFNKEGDADGHLAACNVLLKERGAAERSLLDDYLVEFTSKTSWGSTDMQLLSIRLHQDDVPDRLLTAAEPFMKHRSFFGESVIEPYMERGHNGVRDIVFERAFSPHSIFTNEQPDMINALARQDIALAEQAFEQAWVEASERQRYLVPSSRMLGNRALEAMLNHLPSKEGGGDFEIAFRAMCIELRRRHVEALPIVLMRYAVATKQDRKSLVKVIAWLPEAESELAKIVQRDPDPEIREMAEDLLFSHRRSSAAVESYRADPASNSKLQYAMETVDPEMLYRLKDEWSITELIQASGQQTLIAEDAFVRRFNKVAKTRLKRARIRPRTRKPIEGDYD